MLFRSGGFSKLVWCEDESGARHPQLLRHGRAGTLDVRRDALVQQGTVVREEDVAALLETPLEEGGEHTVACHHLEEAEALR